MYRRAGKLARLGRPIDLVGPSTEKAISKPLFTISPPPKPKKVTRKKQVKRKKIQHKLPQLLEEPNWQLLDVFMKNFEALVGVQFLLPLGSTAKVVAIEKAPQRFSLNARIEILNPAEYQQQFVVIRLEKCLLLWNHEQTENFLRLLKKFVKTSIAKDNYFKTNKKKNRIRIAIRFQRLIKAANFPNIKTSVS